MTETEREYLLNKGETEESRYYQAVSRIRSRVDDELAQDVAILRENHPRLYEELREVVCDE